MLVRSFVTAALVAASVSCASSRDRTPGDHDILQDRLGIRLMDLQSDNPAVPGFAVAVIDNDELIRAATGHAAPDGRRMTPDTPVRIASITKTFVAAATLRLWEDGRLDLDSSVQTMISAEHDRLLSGDGYDTGQMTVRHLLMHASGLNDHFGSDAFEGAVFRDPGRQWSRTDQVEIMVRTTDPLGDAGGSFHYSDTGYVLLGEIIERLTGQSLGAAVRELNRLEEIGLPNIRWEGEATRTPNIPSRAHQFYRGVDTYFLDGSVDAFGGGGVIASVEDIARYYSALFSGQIFNSEDTLRLMMKAPGHPQGSPYRMGLFVRQIGNHRSFAHGGFWGVDVVVLP